MKRIINIGMDVHKETINLYGLDEHNMVVLQKIILNRQANVKKEMDKIKELYNPIVCYEAGCTGFKLYRDLEELNISCKVIAPTKIPRKSSNRIKTDKRDAKMLAELLSGGLLEGIHIPSENNEYLRDLLRMREDIKKDRARARQRILSFLLRYGMNYSQGNNWTIKHKIWLSNISFEDEYREYTLEHYLSLEEEMTFRLERIDARIIEIAQSKKYRDKVNILRCFKGIDYLTALSIICEVGNFKRFLRAEEFMGYLGLIPGESSSGKNRRQKGITKTGNKHLRTLLIETSWHYTRSGKNISKRWATRMKGQNESLIQYTKKAFYRLQKKYYKLVYRNKAKQIAITAIARELSGFIWGAMTNNIQIA